MNLLLKKKLQDVHNKGFLSNLLLNFTMFHKRKFHFCVQVMLSSFHFALFLICVYEAVNTLFSKIHYTIERKHVKTLRKRVQVSSHPSLTNSCSNHILKYACALQMSHCWCIETTVVNDWENSITVKTLHWIRHTDVIQQLSRDVLENLGHYVVDIHGDTTYDVGLF